MPRAALICLVAAGARAFETPTWWEKTPFHSHLEKDEFPDPAKFPGATEKETDEAFPRGVRPKKMEAWAKDADGNPAPCWQTTILQDTTTGWEGTCLGLAKTDGIESSPACKEACWAESLCPSWQFNPTTGCFLGDGKTCDAARHPLKGETAERIQHGAVSVLINTKSPGGDNSKAFQVMGLTHVGMFHQADGKLPEKEAGAQRCKHMCYSSILCQIWQYSAVDGCWIERGENRELDTFTTDDMRENSAWEQEEFIAGEYIQHYCPENTEAVAPAPEKPVVEEQESPNVNPEVVVPADPPKTWLWVLLGLVGLLLILGAIVAYICSGKKEPAKKRAVKVRAPEPPPPAQPLMVVQTVMPPPTMQTVMPTVQTYAAPQAMATYPQATYAAPQQQFVYR